MLALVFRGEVPDIHDYDVVRMEREEIHQGDMVYFEREDEFTVVMKELHHADMMAFTGKAYCVEHEVHSKIATLRQIAIIHPFGHGMSAVNPVQ